MSTNMTEGNNDIIDRLIYPYLQQLDQYIPEKISPNTLTGIGLCGSILSALSLTFIPHRIAYLLASLGLMIWIVFDGLDGVHARNTKKCSTFGMFFDHVCDQISMLIVSFAFMIHFNLTSELFIFIFLLRAVTNAIVYIYQSCYGILFLPALGASFEMFSYSILFLFLFIFQNMNTFSLQLFGNNFTLIQLLVLVYLYILPRLWLSYFKLAKASSKA